MSTVEIHFGQEQGQTQLSPGQSLDQLYSNLKQQYCDANNQAVICLTPYSEYQFYSLILTNYPKSYNGCPLYVYQIPTETYKKQIKTFIVRDSDNQLQQLTLRLDVSSIVRELDTLYKITKDIPEELEIKYNRESDVQQRQINLQTSIQDLAGQDPIVILTATIKMVKLTVQYQPSQIKQVLIPVNEFHEVTASQIYSKFYQRLKTPPPSKNNMYFYQWRNRQHQVSAHIEPLQNQVVKLIVKSFIDPCTFTIVDYTNESPIKSQVFQTSIINMSTIKELFDKVMGKLEAASSGYQYFKCTTSAGTLYNNSYFDKSKVPERNITIQASHEQFEHSNQTYYRTVIPIPGTTSVYQRFSSVSSQQMKMIKSKMRELLNKQTPQNQEQTNRKLKQLIKSLM